MSEHPILSRRTAVCGLLVGLIAPGALVACSSSAASSGPKISSAPGTELAAVSAVPVGGGVVVNGPNGKVLLVQEVAGTVTAYDARCPHAGTPVNPPANGIILCPNHGSEFNPATGAVTRGPSQSGLVPIAVKIAGPQVVLA